MRADRGIMKEMELTGLSDWKWEMREREESRPLTGRAEGLVRKDDKVKWSCPAPLALRIQRWESSAHR